MEQYYNKNSRGRYTNIWVGLFILLVCIGLGAMYVRTRLSKMVLIQVVSESMKPEIEVGDLLLAEKIPMEKIRIKDIVVYTDEFDRNIVHRVIAMKYVHQQLVSLSLKGDDNPLQDEGRVNKDNYKAKVLKVYKSEKEKDLVVKFYGGLRDILKLE